jgi:hypothetical protein
MQRDRSPSHVVAAPSPDPVGTDHNAAVAPRQDWASGISGLPENTFDRAPASIRSWC